jgi:hypothetical protein
MAGLELGIHCDYVISSDVKKDLRPLPTIDTYIKSFEPPALAVDPASKCQRII